MAKEDELAGAFEEARPHLRQVAFRLLGQVADADDAVQDAWLRAFDRDLSGVENLKGWLTTVVSRLCLDRLRARKRQDSIAWQEEDSAAQTPPQEETQLLAESVGLAMLVVLDRLSPLERVAFVLHDAFAIPFEEIAAVVDRSPVATKKLASRARARVYGAEPAGEKLVNERAVVEAFLTAARAGDLDGLVAVLAPDVVRRVDSGARDQGRATELRGADAVAKETSSNRARAAFARVLWVDGTFGAVVAPLGRLRLVLRFTVSDGRISAYEVLGDEQALEKIDLRVLPR